MANNSVDKKRMNPNSLANLDPKARFQDKKRTNLTLLPETIAWLKQSGNASARVDDLVQSAKVGTLKPTSAHTHEQTNGKHPTPDDTHKQIEDLKAQLAACQSENQDIKKQLSDLQEENRELSVDQGCALTLEHVEDTLKRILENVKDEKTGYASNSFSRGLKDLKNLLMDLG